MTLLFSEENMFHNHIHFCKNIYLRIGNFGPDFDIAFAFDASKFEQPATCCVGSAKRPLLAALYCQFGAAFSVRLKLSIIHLVNVLENRSIF